MMWIFTLAFLYLGSSVTYVATNEASDFSSDEEGSDHLPDPVTETGFEQCSLLFDVTKEEHESLRNRTADVSEKLQRYLLCQLIFTDVIKPDLTISDDLMKEYRQGLTSNKTQIFIDCFETTKDSVSDDTVPHILIWKVVECIRERIPEDSDQLADPPTETGFEQCSLLFGITKEDRENLRSGTADVTERIQRFLLCQLIFTDVVNPDLTINADVVRDGLTSTKTKIFIDCFEKSKNSGETVPHLVVWKAIECLREEISEEAK